MAFRSFGFPRYVAVLWVAAAAGAIALYSSARFSDALAADTDNTPMPTEATDPRYSKKLPLPDKHTKKDPVEANGPIFEGWEKPDATLIFTGAQDGYLEPCGCAGLTNQKGGLKRRHSFLKGLAKQGWNPVPLDSGGQVKRFGRQAQIKLRRSLESLIALGYRGVAFGTADLRMELVGELINIDPKKNPMVSANVGFFGFDDNFSKRFVVIESGGMKIGVTSVLGKKEIDKLGKKNDVDLLDPVVALKQVVPDIISANCDQHVLMVHGKAAEAEALAQHFPAFHWVVAGLGADEPMLKPKKIQGAKGMLIEPGHKGQYAVAIGLYKEGKQPFRSQNVPLDHRFKDSPDMQRMLVAYQQELKTMTLKGLGIKAMPHPTGGKFAGSDACKDCHTEAWKVFANTPHAHATNTLVKLDPPRHFDPECLSCHVTGWNPQKYVPFNSGYLGLTETPKLVDNGCENCHGPAAKHVAAENGEIDLTDEQMEELRQALHMELVPNEGNKDGQEYKKGKVVQNCMQCHDLDNSPDFDFQLYWPWVEHHGKD